METFQSNEIIVTFLNRVVLSSTLLSWFVIFCAVYLGWVMLLALLVYLYRARPFLPTLKIVGWAIFSALLALVLVNLIKMLFPVARPFHYMDSIKVLFIPADLSSFPSSHMAFFGALAITFFFSEPRLGKWFIGGVLLIGLARVAAGIHYPLDIIAGLFIALMVAFIFSPQKGFSR